MSESCQKSTNHQVGEKRGMFHQKVLLHSVIFKGLNLIRSPEFSIINWWNAGIGWEDSEDSAPLRIHNVWLVVKSPPSSSSSSSSSTVSQADKNNVRDVNQNQRCWTMDFLVLMIGVLGGKLQVKSWQNPSSSNFSSRIPSNHVP